VQDRFNWLDTIGNTILARKEELGRLLSREEGKTLPEGIGEAARAGQIFKFLTRETLRLARQQLPLARTRLADPVHREPIGVVGIITPWNFPTRFPPENRAGARLWQLRRARRPSSCPDRHGRSPKSSSTPACPKAYSTSSWDAAASSARR
jgi:hypothetical protein